MKKFGRDVNLSDLGVMPVAENHDIIIGDKKKTFPVYKIPINLLKYNSRNGRIYSELRRDFKIEQLLAMEEDEYNKAVEDIIWNIDRQKNSDTKESIKKFGQLVVGVVLDDGTVVDGNRRFTCLRFLNREYPEDPNFKYFKACIIPTEGTGAISQKELRMMELAAQFGQEDKVSYSAVNKALSVYEDIEINKAFTIEEMAKLINEKSSSIVKMINTVKLLNAFLDYFNCSEDYLVAKELNIYFPLEPLADFFRIRSEALSEIDKQKMQSVFYEYLSCSKLELPTQTLRKSFVNIIFKNNKKFERFIEKYEKYSRIIAEEIIAKDYKGEDFIEACKDFRETEISKDMVSLLEEFVRPEPEDIIQGAQKRIEKIKKEIEDLVNDYTLIKKESTHEAQEGCLSIRNGVSEIIELLKDFPF